MRAVFDQQVAAYERWYATPLGQLVDRLEKEALLEHLPPLKGREVLEVGCGTGNISLFLAARGAKVVGLDLSAPMLAQAAWKARQRQIPLRLVRAAAEALPFPGDRFQGVVSVLALNFIPGRERVLEEMVRVLRPGGFLVVAVLNRFSLFTLRRRVRSWFRPTLWRGAEFTSPAELRRLVAARPELQDFRFDQAVYFPPLNSFRLLPLFLALKRLGRRLSLPGAAFLVAAAAKKL